MLTDEYRYRILKILEADPGASQRRIARELDVSLGRVNYCLRALVEQGLVKTAGSTRSKQVGLYLLTRKGVGEKARVTLRYLKARLAEYETLKADLAELRREASRAQRAPERGKSQAGQRG